MPYDAISELPDTTKALPKHAKEIYMKAFNNAFEQHDGNEGTAHAIAWSAVERSYEKKNGRWVAKEAKMLSNENKKNLLQTALVSEYGLNVDIPKPNNVSIEEVFDSEIIYNIDGQLYQCTYELGENDTPSFGDPKKVTSTKIYKTKEALSMENKRSMLDAALVTHLGLGEGDWAWIEDMTETEVIYNRDRQTFKAPYSIAEDRTVTIGEPIKVTRQVTYTPMESLQKVYSEIVQEVGKRNATLDAARVKKILELCQELLSSEADPPEKKAKEALKEATAVLELVKEQAVVKIEDGVQFPAIAFAYVPDVENSSKWKLRIWEDLEKKVTRSQLKETAAALSPGGFKGQKVTIPSADLSAVKRKIRSEYRNLDVEDEDIPKWVKETETREEIKNFIPLTEATFDKGRAQVIVIKAGFNATEDRYYPAEMLKRDFGIFEGQKMYADHPTEAEDEARPERSIKDWVATLTEVKCDENGVVTGIAEIIEPWLMKKLASLKEKQMLSDMGISINAVGSASKGEIDGKETLVIEKLVAARSVDFVTEPGAGGIVTFYESDRNRDIDLIELSKLKERRPDLVKIIEANVRAEITKEVRKAMENEELIKEKDEQIVTLTKERDNLKEAAEKAEKDKAIAEAQATIKEAVDKAELPDAAKARLIERYKDAESADGITEAIDAEIEYVAKLNESGKVRGLGKTDPEGPTDKDREDLKESYRKMHPEWDEAQLEVAVTGR